MTDLEKLWKSILGEIKIEISIGGFTTFFKDTTLLSLENDTATISVKNGMTISYIKQKGFDKLVKHIVDKHTGKDTKIVFTPRVVQEQKPIEKPGTLFVEEVKKKPIGHLPRVRAEYTFETLAVSPANQLAFVSAQKVAQNIGTMYNPLFIYGPVGVGKTHLMQAIANEVYRKNPDLKIVYTTSEEFTNEVVEAIRSNDTTRMKKRFRTANLLIIDDVQFIAGKDKVQEELFHTFNILIDNAAQIVLTSDKPPSEIKKLEKRLSSRFAGGLTVDVEPPDFELRAAIVMKKAEKLGYKIPIAIAKVLAEKEQDVRSLEGALMQVVTKAQATGEVITESVAMDAITRGEREEKKIRLHPDDIIKYVCNHYGLKSTQIKGPKRAAYLVKARQILMYLLYNELGMTYVEIGNQIGGRDHTTVMYAVDKMGKLIAEKNPPFEEIMGITKNLRG